jgi:hypothetical protein
MSALAFFPWLSLNSNIGLKGYRLIRYERGDSPGIEQETVDGILQAYLHQETKPVPKATLLLKDGRGVIEDISDDEVADRFEVAELVALAGLAAREYFLPTRYSNRETFNLVVQRFTGRGHGVGVTSRRRDGSTSAYVSPSQNRVRRPLSQNGVSNVMVDEALLRALLAAREHKNWEHLSEAVYFFGRANTDSDVVSEESECVEMVGAFERLLGCSRSKEDDLARRFMALWQPVQWIDPAQCSRIPARIRSLRVAETWIRDFFGYRGFHAHGRRRVQRPTAWSRHEHLLLGAYAFPLLVKLWLAKRGLYEVTDRDESDIDVFEALTCANHFEVQSEEEIPRHPWNEIRGSVGLRRAIERGWKKVSGEATGQEGSGADSRKALEKGGPGGGAAHVGRRQARPVRKKREKRNAGKRKGVRNR